MPSKPAGVTGDGIMNQRVFEIDRAETEGCWVIRWRIRNDPRGMIWAGSLPEVYTDRGVALEVAGVLNRKPRHMMTEAERVSEENLAEFLKREEELQMEKSMGNYFIEADSGRVSFETAAEAFHYAREHGIPESDVYEEDDLGVMIASSQGLYSEGI